MVSAVIGPSSTYTEPRINSVFKRNQLIIIYNTVKFSEIHTVNLPMNCI